MKRKKFLNNWGYLGGGEHDIINFEEISKGNLPRPYLSIGNGRSYGDVGLNKQGFVHISSQNNNFIHFDKKNGLLHAESGVLLGDIQNIFLPLGWMLPVTPGTQYVTLGGAVANDIHGKNHHLYGTFGHHVTEIVLYRSDSGIILCNPNKNSDIFKATIGGLGLTGTIISVVIKLRAVVGGWLDCESHIFNSLEEFFYFSKIYDQKSEYSVSWVDCTSVKGRVRGVSFYANHSDYKGNIKPKKIRNFPINLPFSLINSTTQNLFNRIYYRSKASKVGRYREDYNSFFYPLDTITNWNKVYGNKGFYQYQSVIPNNFSYDATREMLELISRSNQGSFLMVLKHFGDLENVGMLSFPMYGVTLAMDFPNKGAETLSLFDKLDKVVLSTSGRLYPAKDIRMSAELFRKGYPAYESFLPYRDPEISSDMSLRLMGS